MIDIKLIREQRDLVKENIKKKFQDEKLPLVDEVYELDIKYREAKVEVENLKANKNKLSSEIGKLMAEGKKDEAEKIKEEIKNSGEKIIELETTEEALQTEIKLFLVMKFHIMQILLIN